MPVFALFIHPSPYYYTYGIRRSSYCFYSLLSELPYYHVRSLKRTSRSPFKKLPKTIRVPV